MDSTVSKTVRNTLAALAALILGGCGSILFSDHVGCDECDPGVPVEGTGGRITQPSTNFPWVPLIDECMAEGGTRSECIDALPPEVLEELEAWEARNARMRRQQMSDRDQ